MVFPEFVEVFSRPVHPHDQTRCDNLRYVFGGYIRDRYDRVLADSKITFDWPDKDYDSKIPIATLFWGG